MPPPKRAQPAPPPRRKKKAGPSGAEIVSKARSWIGVPYLFGGTTRSGVDCSGLIMNVGQEVGLNPPRTSEEQWAWAEHITEAEAGAGDLVFFVGAEIDPPPGHVGIVVVAGHNGGTMIDAPHTGATVSEQHYSNGPGSSRIIGYARMRGASKSSNTNPFTTVGGSGSGVTSEAGAGFAGAVGTFIAVLCVILLLLLAFAALIGAGILFRGR